MHIRNPIAPDPELCVGFWITLGLTLSAEQGMAHYGGPSRRVIADADFGLIRLLAERTNMQAVSIGRQERLGASDVIWPGLDDIVCVGGVVAIAVQEAEDTRL